MERDQVINVRRLGWAGFEIESGGEVLLIDPLEAAPDLEPFVGAPQTLLPEPSRPGEAAAVLVTHLHSDHADPTAIGRALGPDGVLLRPKRSGGGDLESAALAGSEAGLAEAGIAQREVAPWERYDVGPFAVTAVPAVDGFGDPQVSWVVEAAGRRVFHGGDTIFHGSWWSIAMRCGPIDLALLPVNGPVVDLPHRQPPNPLVSVMDPGQAAIAAQLLRAGLAVPMHYDTFGKAPIYVQTAHPAERFAEAASGLGVKAAIVEPGERVDLR